MLFKEVVVIFLHHNILRGMANDSCLEWWQHLKDFGLVVRSSQATASNYADFVKIQKTRKARESALKVVGYLKSKR